MAYILTDVPVASKWLLLCPNEQKGNAGSTCFKDFINGGILSKIDSSKNACFTNTFADSV